MIYTDNYFHFNKKEKNVMLQSDYHNDYFCNLFLNWKYAGMENCAYN